VNFGPISPLASITTVSTALAQASRYGWMSDHQYRCIAEKLLASPGCSLLVFGIGYDSLLWSQCVSGTLAFVEDDPKFMTMAPADARIVLYEYGSRVGQWLPVPDLPSLIDRPWDYVLVDGPAGFSLSSPGRQFPIEWSRRLATCGVFIHDYQRPWERAICDKVWGPPSAVVDAADSVPGDLAIYRLSPSGEVIAL
jgi:hypothetical protein